MGLRKITNAHVHIVRIFAFSDRILYSGSDFSVEISSSRPFKCSTSSGVQIFRFFFVSSFDSPDFIVADMIPGYNQSRSSLNHTEFVFSYKKEKADFALHDLAPDLMHKNASRCWKMH